MTLDPGVEGVLVHLVEANLTVERYDRRFVTFSTFQSAGLEVQNGGLTSPYTMADRDLEELQGEGLVEIVAMNMDGTQQFDITREGYAYVEAIQQRGEPLGQIEQTVESYIEAEGFRERHPEAYRRWRLAHDYMAADPIEHAERIGFECREALPAFANSLAALNGVEASDSHFDTISAVIAKRRPDVGKRPSALLVALYKLWQTVNGVDQRQTHARSVTLDADDARRCVFYTGLVMYELDRTLA